jgi:hypothetical protein
MTNKEAALLQQIAAALGTDEEGTDFVNVARNAHRAELKLAQLQRYADHQEWNKIKDYFSMPHGGT